MTEYHRTAGGIVSLPFQQKTPKFYRLSTDPLVRGKFWVLTKARTRLQGIFMPGTRQNKPMEKKSEYHLKSTCPDISADSSWTILYDTIYAIQDVKDNTKASITSIAVRHKSHTKVVLTAVALIQVLLLTITGLVPALGYVYFARTCGGTIITLGVMLRNLDAESPANCLWWFKYGCWMTGGAIASGLIGEYITRLVLV